MEKKVWQGNLKNHTSKNFLMRYFNNKLKKDIIKFLRDKNPSSILDAGCGEGFVTKELAKTFPKAKILAVDPERDYIEYAKKFNSLSNITFKQEGLYSVNNKYDLVVMTEVLEHLENPEKAVKKLVSLSRKYLLITVPNEPFFRIGNFLALKYMKDFGNTPGHINNWTKNQLSNLLSKFNLKYKIKTSTFWNLALITL